MTACTCGKGDEAPAIVHADDCPCIDWVSGSLEGAPAAAKVSHDELVLDLLSDGKPHEHMELYGLGVMARSRVASLRRKGYDIPCVKTGGEYIYRLVSSPDLCSVETGAQSPAESFPPGALAAVTDSTQLSLLDVAA